MESKSSTQTPQDNLSADLLRGADKIAEFLFGDAGERRKVYHLAETSRLPLFRLGSVLCARRSVLIEWIRHQEQRCWSRYCPATTRASEAAMKPESDQMITPMAR
jgi:hypothetical protein